MKLFLSLTLLLSANVAIAHTNICSFQTQTLVSAVTTMAQALAANPSRKCLIVENVGSSAVNVYVKLGSTLSSTTAIVLQQYGAWEPVNVPTDSINIGSASGSQNVFVMEGR